MYRLEFQYKKSKYISVTKYDATWVNETDKHDLSFDITSRKLAIDQCFPLLAV